MEVSIKEFLDSRYARYNHPGFIANDPVSIPHLFTGKQDIEIMGFFAAILAWGQRKTIINKCKELIDRFSGAPADFILHHSSADLQAMLGFKHRTFNDTDLLYFIEFLKQHYTAFDSLEDAFLPFKNAEPFREEFIGITSAGPGQYASSACLQQELALPSIETHLNYFRSCFFSLPGFPRRTLKHVSSPAQKSTCKRLCMFLRWMVRKDDGGVDFGIWNRISPAQLICPCDLHVDRVARQLGLISRKPTDWQTAVELTVQLRKFDPADPVKYDFALFGMGIEEGVGKRVLLKP